MTRPPDLDRRLSALDRARALGVGRLDPEERARLDEVRTHASERLARGDRCVVVALGGGTGSGKSSLFNALTGSQLSPVGAVRPVTSEPLAAAVGEPADCAPLLDWLEVRRRHLLPADERLPEGLVLIDLPDHDSVARDHRDIVDRFVARVDVLVWVVDPLKYAQRALHADYLREMAAHAEVTIVVLNRIDELAPADRETVRADLASLLAAEGLEAARVVATSAATGEGVGELSDVIRADVHRRHAVAARIAADVVAAGAEVTARCRPVPDPVPVEAPELTSAMASAVGAEGLAADAERAYRQDARAGSGPLLTGAVVALLALFVRPLRRWRTGRARRRAVALRGPEGGLSVGVRHALLGVVERSTDGAAQRWRVRLRGLAEEGGAALARALDAELERIELTPQPRAWWRLLAVVWTLVELVAVAGLLWLTASAVLVWLQLPPLPSPDVAGRLSLPTVLLLAGGVGWLLVAGIRRRAVDRGAARHRRTVAERVRREVDGRARTHVLAPLADEVAAIRELDEALETAAAG